MINGSVDAEKLRETPCDLEFFYTQNVCALFTVALCFVFWLILSWLCAQKLMDMPQKLLS